MPRKSVGTPTGFVRRNDLKPRREPTPRQLLATAARSAMIATKPQRVGRDKPPLPAILHLTPEQQAFLQERDARRAARTKTT